MIHVFANETGKIIAAMKSKLERNISVCRLNEEEIRKSFDT